MKKIILSSFVILSLFLNTSFVNAYSFWEFESQKAKYSVLIKDKLSAKLDSFSEEQTKILFDLIVKRINIFEKENNLEDTRNFNELVIYYALKDYLAENIADFQNILTITVIDDNRCTNCQTDLLVKQLEVIPFVKKSKIIKKDFYYEWINDYLKENYIKYLPAIIFSTNDIDDSAMKPYLTELNSWEYSLNVWSNYDPFVVRSDKGFLLLDKEKLQEVKNNSYIKWKNDAKITWIEYSDLECPYCAMLHNSDVEERLKEKYGDNLNIIFNHFPLDFHKNAMPWAQILECVWEQLWSDAFYSLIDKSYSEENSNKDFLIDEAVKLWSDKEELESCLDDNRYEEKIDSQMLVWAELFWITWTPWSVLINNETGEYEVLAWAYPYESFETIVDNLLK